MRLRDVLGYTSSLAHESCERHLGSTRGPLRRASRWGRRPHRSGDEGRAAELIVIELAGHHARTGRGGPGGARAAAHAHESAARSHDVPGPTRTASEEDRAALQPRAAAGRFSRGPCADLAPPPTVDFGGPMARMIQPTCDNMNQTVQTNSPVAHCPQCGRVVNDRISKGRCDEQRHADARRRQSEYCVDCGQQLIARH